MITGTHILIYSTEPDADRAFSRDVLGLKSVDAGEFIPPRFESGGPQRPLMDSKRLF